MLLKSPSGRLLKTPSGVLLVTGPPDPAPEPVNGFFDPDFFDPEFFDA